MQDFFLVGEGGGRGGENIIKLECQTCIRYGP